MRDAVWHECHVSQFYLRCRLMDILRSAVIDKQAVSDIDVVYAVQTCQSAGFDARIRPSADYAVDMDILEVGQEGLGRGRHPVVMPDGTVRVGGLEDHRFALDVAHVDV